MASGGDERMTIASDLVVTKYKMAAEIANKVLRELLAEIWPTLQSGLVLKVAKSSLL